MDSPANRPAASGSSLERHKRLRLSTDSHSSSTVVDPFAMTDFLDRLHNVKFGSITDNIESVLARKVQLLGPYAARYPTLVNHLLKAVVKCDEETHDWENQQVSGLAQQSDIDLEVEQIEKFVPQAPFPVVIIDLEEEVDTYQNSFLPCNEVVLPEQSSPVPGTTVSLEGSSLERHERLRLSTDSHLSSTVVDPFTMTDFLNRLHNVKFGSVTEDTKSILARKVQLLGPYAARYPTLVDHFLKAAVKHDEETLNWENQQVSGLTQQNGIDLEGEQIENFVPQAPFSVVTIDSEEEDDTNQNSFLPCNKVVLSEQSSPVPGTTVSLEGEHIEKEVPPAPSSVVIIDSDGEDDRSQHSLLPFNEVVLPDQLSPAVKMAEPHPPVAYRGESEDQIETSLTCEGNTGRDKGVYVGVSEEEDNQVDTEDEELGDIWREMSMAIECSKDVSVNPLPNEELKKDDCDRSFILKDDLGYVCRVCGLIDRGIETMFEFQYKVKRSTRAYTSDSWNGKEKGVSGSGINIAKDDIMVTDISAHPRHVKQMKPHQVEGFNFLVRNLVGDHPGGCILAHSPGSGKTFIIISFLQSFLGKYPNARPLVVLPKGTLSTWKKEFQTWQVEDIPLYDFYTVKADTRSQQLEVLKQWVEWKSILFLGYTQFSKIICENGTSSSSTACQEILLKVPSILILDEGHNPRNDNTDMVHSLAKVQTSRKVVLSGTLYQNHVKEVFNILNLVRPKFLKMETPSSIVKRIFSRVQIPSGKRGFFDMVEDTLQKDTDFKRKVAVIQDLREMTRSVIHYYKGDFLDELPCLVDFTVVLNLTPRQKHKTDKLKKLSRFKTAFVGSAVYLHPKLKPLAEKCGENSISDNIMDDMLEKLDVKDGVKSKFFYNMLNLCNSAGEKLLVFSQYLLPLKYLERLVMKWMGWSLGKEIFVISGESSSEEREWSMEKFNNSPDAKVLFGSIKACGEGISLVGASRVIVLDVHLNPSVTRQAIGRAFRPGQKKKVFVYRLIAADSPEEEDHRICFKKELISKMWFEWNEYFGDRAFEVETIPVKECGDLFFESPLLGEDVKTLYKR